ncbi:hypothetical protein C7T94_05365 [Pedobacter yulinensis]|uniref:Uncharacterized protein n=1 Tax=Pedobacter yulinensis TaxID=2126353 RepID=A0A2T3HNZ7_9SPHI|nr:SPFH domain-containing protein [Pedobacter yulinensis]PST84159.1 hypothetical protein C7T94_05365 [Pedobacter yulinensis]
MKILKKTVFFLAAATALVSCDRAQSNVQTLYTSDCGVSWKLIKAGEAVPKGVGMCSYKVTIPDYPMQGESIFKSAFKNRVMAKIEVTYDYSITDAKLYIGEAKYLGKMNSDSDSEVNSSKAYETAENSVIDKRIKEVARNLLINEDIVEFNQNDFESDLLKEVNNLLKSKGVTLNFLSFVPIPEEQTRQAIDVVTAMKIYESKGLGDVGRAVSSARAGATKIDVNVPEPKTETEESK